MRNYGAESAQEYEITLTIYEMKMTVNAIMRIRQTFEMVKINLLPLLQSGKIGRARGEGIMKSLAFASREAQTDELKERVKYNFLKDQLAVQRKNLARMRGQKA